MKIVVGYLRTPEGQAALGRAIEEAKLREAELVVVHSIRGGGRSEEREVLQSRKDLAEVEEQLVTQLVSFQVRELVLGHSPSEDLLEFAGRESADMIVIGIRRRSPVGKLVLGSNAQDILLRAECAVLAVKAGRDADA